MQWHRNTLALYELLQVNTSKLFILRTEQQAKSSLYTNVFDKATRIRQGPLECLTGNQYMPQFSWNIHCVTRPFLPSEYIRRK